MTSSTCRLYDYK